MRECKSKSSYFKEVTVLQTLIVELCIFGVSVLFLMYFLYRSEDIETLYVGADKPTIHSYIIKIMFWKNLLFCITFLCLLCEARCQLPLKQKC